MIENGQLISTFLDECEHRKGLSDKTIKAYKIDLRQFREHIDALGGKLGKTEISDYLSNLHQKFKPKTAKRKIACLKAFFHYLEFEELLEDNPFDKIQTQFKEPQSLPRTISLDVLSKVFNEAYTGLVAKNCGENSRAVVRDIAVLELLFATGMRVSELCELGFNDIDLSEGTVKIFGKGSKERIMQISNRSVIEAVKNYSAEFSAQMLNCSYFFINRLGKRLSEQSVRNMINRYAIQAKVAQHITPHMFRHSFATLLLEEDVDIRCIQRMLGHSSILTTQIYTHVCSEKQRQILVQKHPRNKMAIACEIASDG
ncbi:integrase [Clostridia bacterium]|nr:integrase [Clostridia bacterium]